MKFTRHLFKNYHLEHKTIFQRRRKKSQAKSLKILNHSKMLENDQLRVITSSNISKIKYPNNLTFNQIRINISRMFHRDSKTLEEAGLPRNQKALRLSKNLSIVHIHRQYWHKELHAAETSNGILLHRGVHVCVCVYMYVRACVCACVYAFSLVSIAPKLPCTVTNITIRGGVQAEIEQFRV